MRADRRTFLKVAGLTLLGLGMRPAVNAFAGGAPRTALLPAGVSSPTVASAPQIATPLVGSRWAMVVDVSKWAMDAKDCIEACNREHNIPQFKDPKEEIKWIWDETFDKVFADDTNQYMSADLKEMHLPVLCNHCDNPPCVRVCPTRATWKDESNGIVMMDMHRCIGCRFCVAACPYGSRSFNWKDPRLGLDMEHLSSSFPTRTRGVVEKCTFCYERLAKGLMPACVEASKNRALIFGDMGDPNSEVRRLVESHYTLVRKPNLGTRPQVYYIIS